MSARTIIYIGLLAALASPCAAQDLAIRAGHVVVSADAAPLKDAVVVIRDGKIVAAGADVEIPDGVQLVSRPQAWVAPAFVDACSGLGLVGDRDEITAPIEPDVTTRWLIDAGHRDFLAARADGIGVTCVSPSDRNVFGGEGTVVTSDGRPLKGADPIARLALGPSVLRTDRPPTSRVGALDLLRKALAAAHKAETPANGLERFARGDVRGLFTVSSGADLLSGRALAEPYGLRISWRASGALESKDVAGLDLKGQLVVVGPYAMNSSHRLHALAAALHKAGAQLAFASEAPASPVSGMRLSVALAVRAGLPPRAALRGLTQGGADALGIGELTGSLDTGKRADLIVLSGPPLDLGSRVLELYLNGARAYRRPAPAEAGQ